ncbi:MAG: NAD-dependent epimerase/dehydratase family protein [Minicystis sp.]
MRRAVEGSTPLHVVVGAGGQVGRALVAELCARGLRVRAVARGLRAADFPGAEVANGDIGDPDQARRLCAGAAVVYGCLGAPQHAWAAVLPRLVRGLLAGASASGARLVFADNLYAYGPQAEPLVETMPMTSFGRKPRLRAELSALLLGAHAAGAARVVVARAADFYGPGVETAMLGAPLLRRVIAGERAWVMGDVDAPHTFTYVPDLARALVELGGADDAEGGVWHVPSAPAVSLRAVLGKLAALAGAEARLATVPSWALRAASWVSPLAADLAEMSFQWDRPYRVSHAKFAARFGVRPTPLDDGLRATLAWLRAAPPERAEGRVPAT